MLDSRREQPLLSSLSRSDARLPEDPLWPSLPLELFQTMLPCLKALSNLSHRTSTLVRIKTINVNCEFSNTSVQLSIHFYPNDCTQNVNLFCSNQCMSNIKIASFLHRLFICKLLFFSIKRTDQHTTKMVQIYFRK